MTEEEIKSVVDKLTDVIQVLSTANADDKSEIFRQLGLKLTYHPERRIVEAKIEPTPHGFFGGVRGPTAPKNPCFLTCEFVLDDFGGAR